jgi:hypothetical protein
MIHVTATIGEPPIYGGAPTGSAARVLLGDPDRPVEFTVDTVARKAGLSRMTLYYQFG